MYIHQHNHMYTCIFIFKYTYMFICICMYIYIHTAWKFNIAIENGPFIVDLHIEDCDFP